MPVVEFLENIQKIGMSKTRAAQIFKMHRSKLVLKISSDNMLFGINALAAIRLNKLCVLAESIVQNSMHQEAQGFDAGKWLGTWLELPHAALGGLKRAELMDTEAGANKVTEILGAIESGVYL